MPAGYIGSDGLDGLEGWEFEGLKAAVQILSNYFPEQDRPRFRGKTIDTIERGFQGSGLPVPPWMERLRDELS
jgi:hypothetical protein